MKTAMKFFRVIMVALTLLLSARADAAAALVQRMFQFADPYYSNADVTNGRKAIVFPTLYGTAPNTIFVIVNGTLDPCKANNQALTDLGNGVYSIVVGTGGTNDYSIQCALVGQNSTGAAMVGVFEVSGAAGTIDVATNTSGVLNPFVSITPTITASLILAFGAAMRDDYPTDRAILLYPNTSTGTTRLNYRYTHDLASRYNHQARWFQRLDALGGLGASTLGMSGGFASWYNAGPVFYWNMTAVAIHPL